MMVDELFGSHGIVHTIFPFTTLFVRGPYSASVKLSMRLGTDSCETLGYGTSNEQGEYVGPNGPSQSQDISVVLLLL